MTLVRVEREGSVGRMVLSSPGRKNSLDRAMASELFDACQRLEQDGTVRVIHLTADGDDFCVGADLQALSVALGAGVVTDVESRATPEFQDGVRLRTEQERGK